MRVLTTGSNGQLGKAILKTSPINFEVITTNKYQLNLANKESCLSFINDVNPDWVINCGAFTNVEEAEIKKDLAMSVNYEGPKILSEALLKSGGKLLHISTDYVFDGKESSPYSTDSKRSPINFYGKSKAYGEEIIEKILGKTKQAIILRTSWLMSSSGTNFATKILNLHKTLEEISVISDQISCPTSTLSLAEACWKLIEIFDNIKLKKSNIIYHWCDAGVASWYDVAYEIGKLGNELGLIKKPAFVKPIRSCDYISQAKRPSFSLLSCHETKNHLELPSLHWKEGLYKILKEIND